MPRLSINELTTFRWTFEEDVSSYAAAGIASIGVWRQKLSDFGEERGIDLLAEKGLAVSNLLWAGGFTGSDGRNYRESLDDAEEAIRSAAAMGAGCLVVYSGARNLHTHNHARRLLCGALKELAPMAADLEVSLALEPMHEGCAEEWTFLTELDEVVDLIETIGSDQIKLVFDTYHLGQDRRVIDRIAAVAPHIAVVHLGDSKAPPEQEQNRCRLGEGEVPLKEIVAALASAGYDGDYDVELIGEELEDANYHDVISQSKDVFSELVTAAHA